MPRKYHANIWDCWMSAGSAGTKKAYFHLHLDLIGFFRIKNMGLRLVCPSSKWCGRKLTVYTQFMETNES